MFLLKLIAQPFIFARHSPGINRFFQILDKIIAGMNKNVAVFALAAGILIVAVNVFVRYFSGIFPALGAAINMAWAEETARYCFLWSAFFGAAYGFRNGVHISVTFVIEKFPKKFQKFFVICGHILNTLFLGFMTYASVDVCILNAEIGYMSEAIRSVPLWIFLLFLPISFFGGMYRSIEKIYEIAWTPYDKVLTNIEAEMIHDSTSKGEL